MGRRNLLSREELRKLALGAARDIVERDPRRVKLVPIHSRAIYADFDTPAELRRLQRAVARRRMGRRARSR